MPIVASFPGWERRKRERRAGADDLEEEGEIREFLRERTQGLSPEVAKLNSYKTHLGHRINPVLSPADGGAEEYDRDANRVSPVNKDFY